MLFLFDVTGSMRYAIEGVKRDASAMVDGIKKEFPGASFRTGLIGYRDRYDRQRFLHYDFNEDIDDFKRFMSSHVRATGETGS